MNRLLLLSRLVGLVVFLAGQAIVAQELTAEDYIEFWKPHEGTWKAVSETDGKSESGVFSFRRARNQMCFVLYYESSGSPSVQQLKGYDPVRKKNVVVGFTQDGNLWFHTIGIDGMKKGMRLAAGVGGDWETRIASKDGKATTQTARWKFTQVDQDRLVIVWSDQKEDGKPIPDSKMIMERQPDQPRQSAPGEPASTSESQELGANDYMEYWESLLGSWKTTTETEGKSVPGTWRARLSRTNTCALTYGEGGGFPTLQTIDGFDPVEKKWTVAGFDSDGGFSLSTTRFIDMKKGKRLGVGEIGNLEERLFKSDGTTTATTSKLSCLEFSKDRVVLLYADRKANGKPQPDLKWVCERLPERERRARQ